MSEDLIFYGICAICIILVGGAIGILLVKWGRKFNPYKHKELKYTGKLIQGRIIEINEDRISLFNKAYSVGKPKKKIILEFINFVVASYCGISLSKYLILDFVEHKKQYFYKIYLNSLESKYLALFKAKGSIRNFKIGDNIKLYINPQNYEEYYVDPQNIFTEK